MNLLRLDRVGRKFGNVNAVGGVSLAVAADEIHAVIGPNGAGKTTLFHLITGFLKPDNGAIFFDGKRIDQLPVKARTGLGLIRTFQVTEIFRELTVSENLRVGVETAAGWNSRPWLGRTARQTVQNQVAELMETTSLAPLAGRLAGELAHGDQRVLEVALALSMKPRLLLLDEPTAGMAEHETEVMVALIRRLHAEQGLPLLFIEHDMELVFGIADRITVLDNGRVIAVGNSEQIANDPEVQKAYLGAAA